MSIRAITATTTQPLANAAPDQFSNLAMEALSQTEQMNNQLIAELNSTMQMFKKMLVDVQTTLDATLKKNELLEKEVIQLNATIKENEKLHTAEMKKNTQVIATLSQTVDTHTTDIRSTNFKVRAQEEKFDTLVGNFNKHTHPTGNRYGSYIEPTGTSGVPLTPYQIEKK